MKSFECYLRRAQIDGWQEHYVHYAFLKEALNKLGKFHRAVSRQRREENQQPDGQTNPNQQDDTLFDYQLHSSHQHNAVAEKNENTGTTSTTLTKPSLSSGSASAIREQEDLFQQNLELDIDKATRFLQQKIRHIRDRNSFNKESPTISEVSQSQTFLQLVSFAVANIIAVRQLLIRYNAICQTYSYGSSEAATSRVAYFEERLCFLYPEPQMTSLYDQIRTEELLMAGGGEASALLLSTTASNLEDHYEKLQTLLDSTRLSMEKSITLGNDSRLRDRLLKQLRDYFVLGSSQFGLSLEPKFLLRSGLSLKGEMRLLSKWQTEKEVDDSASFSSTPEGDPHDTLASKPSEMDPANLWGLILNLLSCFLFMMNSYIIEPSSAYYAESLGSSDALSGIMIGAAPWFALISAVGYSFWTNASYKPAILFAAMLMVIGNTLYASAYSFSSMPLCLIGRAIAGLGAPRVINRRYVADATPFALRTMSCAAFALTTALGAALGPGMAILLDSMNEFEFYLPLLGIQYWNGMTGPGYFMALCWGIYGFGVVLSFREPNRQGLEELKQREAVAAGPGDRLANQDQLPVTMTEDEADLAMSEASFDMNIEKERSASDDREGTNSPMYCIHHMTGPTALCMSLIFMKRIALESIVGSTSIVTKNRYGWTIQNVGTLHLVNGMIVIPISIVSGWLSKHYQDRQLATWFLVITVIGMLFLVDVSDIADHETNEDYNEDSFWAVGPHKYIAGSIVAFSGIEACESFVASLMSKVVPSALAVGTFNSGLLATLVGTSGRAVGDLFITLMGLISIRNLLNALVIPGLCLMVLSILLIRRNYDSLSV